MAATGKTIGTDAHRYRIGEQIAKGAFSNVYRCTELSSNLTYAIKVIDIKEVRERKMEDALMSEIRVMQLANVSPYVVSLVDSFVSDHNYYIVMNLAEGGTLLDLIREHKHLSFMKAWAPHFMKQLLLGVDALHTHNIVHRDIKPENILLDESRTHLVISDFGFACECAPDEILRRTCGTLRYCAPELLHEPASYKGRPIDVWAMGVTLYVMLFHTHPYKPEHNDPDAYLASIRAAPLIFPHPVDPEARDMLLKMLDANPSTRWSVNQLLQHPWLRQAATPTAANTSSTDAMVSGPSPDTDRAYGGTSSSSISSNAHAPNANGLQHVGPSLRVGHRTTIDEGRTTDANGATGGASSGVSDREGAAYSSEDDFAASLDGQEGGYLRRKSRSVIYSDLTENVDDGFYAVADDSDREMEEDEYDTGSSPREGSDAHDRGRPLIHHGCSYRIGDGDDDDDDEVMCTRSYRGTPHNYHVSSGSDGERDKGGRGDKGSTSVASPASGRSSRTGRTPTSTASPRRHTRGTADVDRNNNNHTFTNSNTNNDNHNINHSEHPIRDISAGRDEATSYGASPRNRASLSARYTNTLYRATHSSDQPGSMNGMRENVRRRGGFYAMNERSRWRGPMEKLRARRLSQMSMMDQILPSFMQTSLDWAVYLFHLWLIAFYFVFFCTAVVLSSALHRLFDVDVTELNLPFGLQRLINFVLLPLNEVSDDAAGGMTQILPTQGRQASIGADRRADTHEEHATKKKA